MYIELKRPKNLSLQQQQQRTMTERMGKRNASSEEHKSQQKKVWFVCLSKRDGDIYQVGVQEKEDKELIGFPLLIDIGGSFTTPIEPLGVTTKTPFAGLIEGLRRLDLIAFAQSTARSEERGGRGADGG